MKIIILSGCSGWRLWPLSNESRSKQFLKLLNRDDGSKESMAQRIVRQIRETINPNDDSLFFVTTESQADSIRNQIGPNVNIISEPFRRDTFPAIAMACEYLTFEKKVDKNETIIVLPIDTHADDEFYKQIRIIEALLESEPKCIALIGTKPTYPSEKYGYIVPDSDGINVKEYTEKPSLEKAVNLIKIGSYWNTGVVAFKLGYMLEKLEDYYSSAEIDSLESFLLEFNKLPAKSFDYEILEKAGNMKFIVYEGKWKDLGTWNTLTEEMDYLNSGYVRQGEECENTHVINELSIPILVLGAKDMVVAASPDGILVSDKHKSSYIKPYVQQLDARPMHEERKWGEYKVLDYNQYGDEMKSLTKHLTVKAGKHISYQRHFLRDEIWTIVDGRGELLIDGEVRTVERGDVAYIKKGQKHALKASQDEDLQFIEVQIGAELIEEDIERFNWNWNP
ncbi:mannose-1-phosphate guanylyltransferase [Lachnospiraceae bacterium G11]|nr:mannose-1-phosphate guanylyltransferase [Lachnospiraceae bacterium G11]